MNLIHRFAGTSGRVSLFLGGHVLGLLGLLGRLLLKTLALVAARVRFPGRDVVRQVGRMGVGSLGVTALAASTVGISLVFLSLDQLKRLGGLSLLAFFFAKGLLREVCPVVAGVVMAVRIGSQVTMDVGSVPLGDRALPAGRAGAAETDLERLLLPTFLAVMLVGPGLYLVASFVSILAGVVGQTQWSGESFVQFYRMILDNFSTGDLEFGLYKAFLFGVTVVLVSGYVGLLTPPRPEELFRATVTSIVFASVAVLTINALFALSYTASSLIEQMPTF